MVDCKSLRAYNRERSLAYTFKFKHFFPGKTAQAYGWGANVADASAYPDILQEVSVPVVTKAQCATDVTNLEDGMICAGGVAGEDTCSVSS